VSISIGLPFIKYRYSSPDRIRRQIKRNTYKAVKISKHSGIPFQGPLYKQERRAIKRRPHHTGGNLKKSPPTADTTGGEHNP
jgi:hypothetical protein